MKTAIFLAIIKESLRFAFHNVRANLLRTILSLMGITIGVFCIISIFTLVDSVELSIRDSISKFGENIIMVQKYPWDFGSDEDYPLWKYKMRPEVKYREMEALQKRMPRAKAISYVLFIPQNELKYEEKVLTNTLVRATTHDYENIVDMSYLTGRYFTESESHRGDKVIILGYDLATSLFERPEQAIDKKVDLLGYKVKVVGVFKKEGKSMGMGGNQDVMALIPMNFVRQMGNMEKSQFGPAIMVKGKDDVTSDMLEDDLRGAMRGIRLLGPWNEDNFALNKITVFTNFLNTLFSKINLFGWLIAGFSILVGGFGIANIMFVSVKERTSIIGIQKALGAKKYFILVQFLAESIILCLMGGLAGLLFIFLLAQLLNLVLPMTLVLTLKNISIGIGISTAIGIISGYVPSQLAANMDPIEAIRSNG